MLRKLTYACAPASSHTQNLFLYTSLYSQVYIYQESYHGYVGISTRSVHSHTCLCPCECSHLEPLCIHTYDHKYTHSITDTFVYKPMLCKLTYVCSLASAHTQNVFVYIHILTSIHIKNHITDTLVYQPVLCTLTLVCAIASAHS